MFTEIELRYSESMNEIEEQFFTGGLDHNPTKVKPKNPYLDGS